VTERLAGEDVVEVLGSMFDVEIAVAVTDEPWRLPVEALVVPIGSTLDGLAAGASKAVGGGGDWHSLAGDPVGPDEVRVLTTGAGGRAAPSLKMFLATNVGDAPAAIRRVHDAAGRAVDTAGRMGVRTLAMPLLGAGRLGLDVDDAAQANVQGVREELSSSRGGGFQRIVFVGEDERTRQAIVAAWRPAKLLPPEAPERPTTVPPPREVRPSADRAVPEMSATADGLAHVAPDRLYRHLSSSAVEVLGHATAVAADRTDTPGLIDGPLVLLSALTRRRGNLGGVSAVLGRLLTGDESRLPDLLRRLAESLSIPITSLDHEPAAGLREGSADVVVDAARNLGRRTGVADVHVRHLLAAVATTKLPEPVLAALGATSDDLRGRLRAAIRDTVPREAPSVWDEILLSPVEVLDLAGGYSRDTVDDTERIPQDEDRLGVRTYVSMLATVIARRDTPLPLSVGLFGEWGSGKSYFMGLLRDKIQTLSESGDKAYWREIVPISFNAWHYADTNLWASLGNEIFEQLAGPGATASQNREALRDELNERTERAVELRAANERAEQEAARLREELDRARTEAAASQRNIVEAVVASPTIQDRLGRAWTALGISDEVERGQLLTAELHGAGADVDAFRLATRQPRGRILVGVAAVALVVLVLAVVFAGDVSRWVAGGGVVTFMAAVAGVTAVIRKIRTGLRTLTAAAVEIRGELDRSTDEGVTQERAHLRTAEARSSVLQSKLSEVLQRVGELGRELAELDPGRRWYGFVAERAASDEYRRELGLISTIRRDFERLIALLKDWQDNPRSDGKHRRIDRIVLYIDDLDRCSSKQVVDVLQAVHLLLALDLFVVVVGVDPRWLLHSLREQYRTAFRSEEEGTTADSELGDQDAVWRTTPHDYLEKIFNIPFVLPGMTTKSFDRLIRTLSLGEEVKPDAEAKSSSAQGAGGQAAEPADRPALRATESTETQTGPGRRMVGNQRPTGDLELTDEGGSEVRTGGTPQGPVPRLLTEEELTLLASLGPLVRSPRQAKRLLNLYRMVRSTRDLSPASDFIGGSTMPGEYQAVGVLLGLLTAHPRLLGRILAAEPAGSLPGGINHRDGKQAWGQVVAGLEPRPSGEVWQNDVCADMSEVDRLEWTELVERVARSTVLVTLPDLTAFRFWGPRLARFSFVLSPLAVNEEPARAPVTA
jgi:predicted nuclease with TOPRIM domain